MPMQNAPPTLRLAAVFLLSAPALFACEGAQSAPSSSAGSTSSSSLVTGADAGVSCSTDPTAEGCPCSDDDASQTCYPSWAEGDDGSLSCEIGTQTCTEGRWSACGDLHTVVYESAAALINPIDTCNPCSPMCFRAVDTPTCDTTTGGSCDLCTAARRAAEIAAGGAGCTVNTDGATYSATRGGITPAATAPTTPTLTDSDGDGIPDVADSCVGAGAFTAADGSCYGDLFFYHMLPYGGASVIDPAPISTTIRTADVYILMDTTGSMGGELSRLKTDLTTGTFLTGCGNGILGAIRCEIPDAWFGVGWHDDIPYSGDTCYGSPGWDSVYGNRTDITSSLSSAQTGVNGLGLHAGCDLPESQLMGMWAVATGGSIPSYLSARTGCASGRWGYPCFRDGTIPVLINITDAPYHNGPADSAGTYPYRLTTPSYANVVSALTARSMRVMTVQSCGSWGASYCQQGVRVATALGNATGSLGSAGTPYVFKVNADGSGMTSTIVSAVQDLANYSRMDVSARASGDTWGFTKSIAAVAWGPSGSCTGISGGTVFTQCLPGTDLRFNVEFRNTTVMSTSVAQVFTFYIEIVGGGTVVLERIPVRIVVPPVVAAYEASASYWRDYDSTGTCDVTTSCADWSSFTWSADVPSGTSIRFEFRTATSATAVATATPVATYTVTTSGSGSLDIGALLDAAGAGNNLPYLRVTAVLLSSADRTLAPALNSMSTNHNCWTCR